MWAIVFTRIVQPVEHLKMCSMSEVCTGVPAVSVVSGRWQWGNSNSDSKAKAVDSCVSTVRHDIRSLDALAFDSVSGAY